MSSNSRAIYSGKFWFMWTVTMLFCVGVAVTYSADEGSSEDDYLNTLERLRSEENGSPEEILQTKRFPAAAKRALSLFANWRPYYPENGKNKGSGSDFVSAVARGGSPTRPLGQPLRWG